MSVYKEQSISLIPLLHEITVRTKANTSKKLLAEVKTFNESSVNTAIDKAFKALETNQRKDSKGNIKEYQMLKVSE